MRSPHVNVPDPSVAAVFHTAAVQEEHPQKDAGWNGVGFDVGDFEGTEVAGLVLGADEDRSVGKEVG